MIVADPEITIFPFEDSIDYVFLACDGIYDSMTNEEVNEVIWETVNYYKHHKLTEKGINKDLLFGQCLGDCVNNVLKKSLIQNSEDNVTAILVVFKNLFDA